MNAPAVEVCDLVIRYGAKTAVDGLSMRVARSGITAILGPNGAGKTTTMEACEGYRRPSAGSVRVLGLDPITQHRKLSASVGVMLQSGGAWSAVRAVEMLRYVAALHRHALEVDVLVDRLGLGSCGQTPYRRLSGGQQQRLGLALALVGRPELVILDEPTAGLDPQARRNTWDLIEELATDGVTVLLTTHYIEEAERLASEVYVVDSGRVLTSGSPASLTAGGERHPLRFSARPQLDTTTLTARLPSGSTVAESPPGSYRVDGTVTPELLATVTTWCAEQGVLPEGLTIDKPTLEDVFLELTGRELRS